MINAALYLVLAAKYRDVRENGVFEGGNCLSVQQISATALMPQPGADGIDRNAECASDLSHAHRKIRAQWTQWQAVSSLVEPNGT
jgi:hypothetical protein